jgi:hypothetical protein
MVENEETIEEKEMREYVENFIDDFKIRYGVRPVVLYNEKSYHKKTAHLTAKLKPVSFSVVEQIANKILKENLEGANMQFYPITSRKRKRDIINYKHAVCKILYDMGYTVVKIGQCLNINHSTVSVAVAKVEGFLSIQDPVFTYIVKTLQNEIENKTGSIDCI